MIGALPLLFFSLLVAQIYLFWPAGVDREVAEWRQFLLLGSFFPLLVVTSAVIATKVKRQGVGRLLGGVAVTVLLGLWWKVRPPASSVAMVTGAALVQYAVFRIVDRLQRTTHAATVAAASLIPKERLLARVLEREGSLLFPMIVSWGAALTFLHWFPTLPAFLSRYSPWSILVLVASFTLSCFAALGGPGARGGPWIRRIIDAAAVITAFLFSFNYGQQTIGLLSFHWSSYAGGPIDMIRLGGRLLWDVPSSYGFLSILSVAAFDTPTGWDALYLLMGAFLFVFTVLIYALYRLATRTTAGALLGLFLVPGAAFLLSGLTGQSNALMSGPYYGPSTSFYRFGWPMAILGLSVIYYLRPSETSRMEKWLLVTGSLLLAIGFLWSFETGIFCGGAFGPLYLVLVIELARKALARGSTLRQAVGEAAAWGTAPVIALLAAWGSVTAFYLWEIGHAPDWKMHIEYATGFQGGYGAVNIEMLDPVWAVLLVFAVLGAALFWVIRAGAERRALAVLSSAYFGTWAMTSYYVGRSTACLATSMAPHWILALGLVWVVLGTREDSPRARQWLAPVLVPFLTVVLTITYGYIGGLKARDVASVFLGPWRNAHAAHEPFKPSLEPLLQQAGIGIGGNVVILDGQGMPPPMMRVREGGREVYRFRVIQWFPAAMFHVLDVLPPERRIEIVRRYLQRVRMGGWVAYRSYLFTDFQWVDTVLQETRKPGKVFQNRDWLLVEYVPKA